ncbi:hypothetical protein WR25_12362 isoform D [Diploscapter pachys]|uniref:ZP domain-containing protein n=1 Tax=Diploscapter pachys TaxID=2018661 RepID=A0A2A2JA79_9BILA|nr:hypothetical protein WR25_12362 isoform B [Diploscapter pachys]PAV58412.1 hypothetical protein WR25_12362 isoform D [Diploscapter pachys]
MLVTNNQIEVLVPHEECAVPRRRSLHPSGIILDTSLVVSFHPQFTTSDDRLFHFHCFHQKKKNSKNLEIGTPTKDEKDPSKPTCAYSILRFPGGPSVGLVSLGQTVYHQWKCEQFQNSCLHVRNCALVAGTVRYILIDEQGCSKEPQLLPDLSYLNPNEVGVNVTVFGVVDSSIVHFECELLLQPKQNDICPTRQCSNQTEQPDESTEANRYRLIFRIHSFSDYQISNFDESLFIIDSSQNIL